MATKNFDPLAGRTLWNRAMTSVTRRRGDGYGGYDSVRRRVKKNIPAASLEDATLVGSQLANGNHMPALDLDFRAAIRTKPDGRSFLVLDLKALPADIDAFVQALRAASIIRGDVSASIPGSAMLSMMPFMESGRIPPAPRRKKNCWRQRAAEKSVPFPALELAVSAKLLPSSTPGHYHLYVAKELDWKTYRQLLDLALAADLISEKYHKMSVEYKMTMLLKPGLTKAMLEVKAEEQRKANAAKRRAAAKRKKRREAASARQYDYSDYGS